MPEIVGSFLCFSHLAPLSSFGILCVCLTLVQCRLSTLSRLSAFADTMGSARNGTIESFHFHTRSIPWSTQRDDIGGTSLNSSTTYRRYIIPCSSVPWQTVMKEGLSSYQLLKRPSKAVGECANVPKSRQVVPYNGRTPTYDDNALCVCNASHPNIQCDAPYNHITSHHIVPIYCNLAFPPARNASFNLSFASAFVHSRSRLVFLSVAIFT